MKIRRNQEELDELDEEKNDKKKGFVKGSEQVQCNEPLCIVLPKINTLFQTEGTTKQGN